VEAEAMSTAALTAGARQYWLDQGRMTLEDTIILWRRWYDPGRCGYNRTVTLVAEALGCTERAVQRRVARARDEGLLPR